MMGSMLRRGAISGDANLTLNFSSMSSLADLTAVGVSFSRTTSGTYVNASGLVVTASANQPRFTYSSAGVPLGLLLEASATNLLCHSNRLDDAQVGSEQYWVTTYAITGGTTGITGPDGNATSATQFAPISGNGTCIASAAMGTSAQRTFSFWAKRSSGSTNLEYTLDNGTNWTAVTTTSSWQRFTIAATTAAQRVGFRFAANNVYEIWGCQLETGNGSSSTIVTAASTVNRGYDLAYMAGTNFSSWFSTGAGTIVFESMNTKANSQNILANISDGTNTNYIRMGDNVGGGSNELMFSVVGGATQAVVDSGYNPPLNTSYKIAYAWDTNNFAACVNGGAVATDLTGNVAGAGVLTSIAIGLDFYQTFGPNDVFSKNGTIASIKYYARRMTNSEMQAATT